MEQTEQDGTDVTVRVRATRALALPECAAGQVTAVSQEQADCLVRLEWAEHAE